ncbi:MAG TPA: NrsF family protein [Bryobacteraceae bacterium]|nr:NrsF family protein [Bryobacteraceae bacterium]
MNDRDLDLDRLWQSAPESPRTDKAADTVRLMTATLEPVRPLPSPRSLAALFTLFAVALAAPAAFILGPYALSRLSTGDSITVYAALAVALTLSASALAAQMFPAARRIASPSVLLPAVVLALVLIFAALFSVKQEHAFWRNAWNCARAGLEAAAVVALAASLLLRRGALLDLPSTGALTGFFAGLAGTFMLSIHCPDFNLAHVLTGHLAVAAIGAGLGWLVGSLAALRRR